MNSKKLEEKIIFKEKFLYMLDFEGLDMEEELNKMLEDSTDISDIPIDDMSELEAPVQIDLENIDEEAREAAVLLTERLSGYFFDETYLKKHPYIPQKISTSMDSVRRLMKALALNEQSLDILVKNICKTPNKANLFMGLTSMLNGMLNVLNSLHKLINDLEDIFKKMLEECEKTWLDKEKENNEDGSMVVRGSRDFIKELQEKLWSKKLQLNQNPENLVDENVDTQLVNEA